MKQALIVGIGDYPGNYKLEGCANDAQALADVLSKNGDGSLNFEVSLQKDTMDKPDLRRAIINLFNRDADMALFYFSGHGYIGDSGSYIVTTDFRPGSEGVPMDEILHYANESDIRNKIIILDCCHSGSFGAPMNMKGNSFLRKGLTVLTASRDNEFAWEHNGQGIFTGLLVQALKGGAADLKGDITPGGVYSYIDQAIGSWGQRPVFKANITRFTVLRKAKPSIDPDALKQIITFFPEPDHEMQLNKSFIEENDIADPVNVAKFNILKKMNRVALVIPCNEEHIDMYRAGQNSECCRLTELGKHYRGLVEQGRI